MNCDTQLCKGKILVIDRLLLGIISYQMWASLLAVVVGKKKGSVNTAAFISVFWNKYLSKEMTSTKRPKGNTGNINLVFYSCNQG